MFIVSNINYTCSVLLSAPLRSNGADYVLLHHSTETALTLTLDNVFHAADTGSATLLVSLDLSAAFDSIHHNILINCLSSSFGPTGLALDWISSYLCNRRQSVKIGDAWSPPVWHNIWCAPGVCPWPNPFCSLHLTYLSYCKRSQRPAATVCWRHSALHLHICRDHNTEHMSPRVLSIWPTCVVLPQLACFQPIQIWGSLTGNHPEAENALNAQFSQLLRHQCSSHNPNPTSRCHSRSVSFFRLTQHSFHQILFLSHSWPPPHSANFEWRQPISSPALLFLSGWTVRVHVCSASLSRIYLAYREFKTRLLVSSHAPTLGPALPLCWNLSTGFQFQLAFTTYFQVTPHHSPIYLSSLIRPYTFRSFSAQWLCAPHVSSVFDSRGVRSAGPAIWNSSPLTVTSCSSIHAFKKQLKTNLFASAFPSSWIVLDAPLIRWSPLSYLSGCPWFCACQNVCYYYYYYYYYYLFYIFLYSPFVLRNYSTDFHQISSNCVFWCDLTMTMTMTMTMTITIHIARTSRSVASESEARGHVTSQDVCWK